MKTDTAVGIAKSLLWSAKHLQDLLQVAVKVPNPDPLQATGCFLAAVLLRAFAAEVALKGLYFQESGKQAARDHDLSILFDNLLPSTRSSLDRRFQRVQRTASTYDGHCNTIEQVLGDHKADFTHWRYVYEQQGDTHVELLDLEPAVEAVIEEYTDRLRQQSGNVAP